MLERFSASAFQALNAAREEALRLEFSAVDTDHLFLGLAHEQRGLAARTLGGGGLNLGVRALRQAVERARGRGYASVRSEDVVFGPSTLRVLGRAAQRPGPVTAEGLFWALLDEEDGAIAELWGALGLGPEALRQRAERLEAPPEATGTGPLVGGFSKRVASPPLQAALALAEGFAKRHGHNLVGTEELLAGLVEAPESLSRAMLHRLGLPLERLSALAWRLVGEGSGALPSRLGWSRYAERVLDQAWDDARRAGLKQTGTGHVLRALANFDAGGAVTLLEHLQVDPSLLLTELEAAFAAEPQAVEPEDAPAFGSPFVEDEPLEGEAWA